MFGIGYTLSRTVESVRSSEETRMTAKAPHPMDDRSTERPPALPRWVKLLALGVLVAVIVLVVVMLLVGGEHGPGMHGG